MFNIGQKILNLISNTKKRKWLYVLLIFLAIIFFWPILIISRLPKKYQYAWLGVIAILVNVLWLASVLTNQPEQQSQSKPEDTSQTVQTVKIEPQEPEQKQEISLYKVIEVIDGDTVKVDIDGKTETIRLIGVDTPEVVDPRTTVQCFGEEASKHARDVLSGKSIKLEADDTQDNRDKYSRLLRYIFLEDGTNFNKQMISDGFAYEYTYEVPYKYQQEFKTAQSEASNASRGLWSANTCNGQRTKPQTTTQQQTPSTPQTNDCKIKGNISSDDEKIYHMPGQRFYEKTIIDTSKGERWFCSESEAQSAGWRKSKV